MREGIHQRERERQRQRRREEKTERGRERDRGMTSREGPVGEREVAEKGEMLRC